ncbi:MAG: hypothetical protein AMJ65_07385 [Phycisphaerae bacterium SG8_4]|nr:MAG: hypothetical protein AMJ65_07385 [Phycisphaerae bacterium SG8_4]
MIKRQVTTQIGLVPYDNIDEAVEYSLKHDIPFLPELGKLGDAMMDYIERPGNMSCLDTFKRKVAGRPTAKIQCVGPATLILAGYDQDDAFSRTYQHIDALIDGLEVESVILFLDEPALGQAGFDYLRLWSPLFESFDVTSGVHVCGNMNWDELFGSEIEIISFDASKFDITKYPGYRNGKRIAWGVEAAEDVKDFQEGDLLTPPCGMGPKFFNTDDCEIVLSKLSQISRDCSA